MDATWSLIPSFIVIAIAIIVGIRRHRRFRNQEQRHLNLAGQLGIRSAYMSPDAFTLYGNFQGYDLRIEPIPLPMMGTDKPFPILKARIPMVNPNLKILVISKGVKEIQPIQRLIQLDRPVHMSHQLGDWLSITTNDLMFASVLLTDDIKISLYELFSKLDQGLMYIQDEELAFILPSLLTEDPYIKQIQKAAQVMVEIKEELSS